MMYADDVSSLASTCTVSVGILRPSRYFLYAEKSEPAVEMMRGSCPKSARLYAMFPAVPPKFSSTASTAKLTLMVCSLCAKKWSRKCPGKSMMRSYAMEPETRMRDMQKVYLNLPGAGALHRSPRL